MAFKLRFGEVTHVHSDEHRHIQTLEVRHATGGATLLGFDGNLMLAGYTGKVTEAGTRLRTLYQSQKMTVAAMQMAEKKACAHRS